VEVRFLPPSEIDAGVKGDAKSMTITPRFYSSVGPAVLGTLVVADSKGNVLDRGVFQVSGKGKLTILHRNEEVKPVIERGEERPDSSSK
jgi:hypothetical protein